MTRISTIQGAHDCHAHVFGPGDRFAFIAGRSYTPPERLASGYRAMLTAIGIDRGGVVQPSVYGPTIVQLSTRLPNWAGASAALPSCRRTTPPFRPALLAESAARASPI
jgi:predicted TIM-barrel fold metal-dependent hydrolase